MSRMAKKFYMNEAVKEMKEFDVNKIREDFLII
jgi:hypothetical protein